MNRNENETESFDGKFAPLEKWRLFFEVPMSKKLSYNTRKKCSAIVKFQ